MARRNTAPAVEVGQVVGMLADRIEALIAALGLDGEFRGHEYVAFNPTRVDRNLGSFVIRLSGDKAGVWADFAVAEANGDALDLVAYILFRGDKKRAWPWALGWLGLADVDDATARATARQWEQKRVEKRRADAEERRKTRNRALRRFQEAQERLRGTPVDLYLKGRGIDLDLLGRQPRALRFHPNLWCQEIEARGPAWVAAITGTTGAARGHMVGVHRGWLRQRPDGTWTKADLAEPRKSMGAYKPFGGIIPLWRGASGRPLGQAPEGEAIILTEGVEDALTLALALPEYRIAAALSVSNLANIALPPQIATVIIAADNDGDNPDAASGLAKASARFAAEGRVVKIARSPVGKDFNDLLQCSPPGDGRGGGAPQATRGREGVVQGEAGPVRVDAGRGEEVSV